MHSYLLRMRQMGVLFLVTTLLLGLATNGALALQFDDAPTMVAPVPGAQFATNQNVSVIWHPLTSVPVAKYLVSFASPNDDTNMCVWDADRDVGPDTTFTAPHQNVQNPLWVRVRAVTTTGDTTNAGVTYFFVGVTPPLSVPVISGPWASSEPLNSPILHMWSAVSGADHYEVQFANAFPNTSNLFEDCNWDPIRVVSNTSAVYDHQSCHRPLYWRVRAVDANGVPGNWAISYYFVTPAPGENCPTVAVEAATWSNVKAVYR